MPRPLTPDRGPHGDRHTGGSHPPARLMTTVASAARSTTPWIIGKSRDETAWIVCSPIPGQLNTTSANTIVPPIM